jgi:hypothetical protein
MNAKTCKRLRRAAESATVGKPRLMYDVDYRHGGFISKRVSPLCTRGVYRLLKRAERERPV